jgi:hypothetical protein
MGYDMYWKEPATEDERREADRDELEYFRMNIWMMGEARQAMFERSMLNVHPPYPPFPGCGEFGLEERPAFWDEDGEPIKYPLDTAEGMYQRACECVHSGDSGGSIPVYKLMSNDGWRITPEEIERSLAEYTAAPPPCITLRFEDSTTSELEWWGEWIDWLRGAAHHGGFEVY